MGVANSLGTFAFSVVAARVSTVGYRSLASLGICLAWVSMILAGLNYIFDVKVFGVSGLLLYGGLILWFLSLLIVSLVLYRASASSVSNGSTRSEKRLQFNTDFSTPNFGVPFIDDCISRAIENRIDIYYPFLVVHDRDSPGFEIGLKFVTAGIKNGEAVVYLSFSRPYDIVKQQIEGITNVQFGQTQNVIIIDCYSLAYMPEKLREARLFENVLFADPRDPSNVYEKYTQSLRSLQKKHRDVRSIYETLSDFIQVADAELIIHYLRRTVVFEEQKKIKAIYVLWSDLDVKGITEDYLYWFYNIVIHLRRNNEAKPNGKYHVRIERMFNDHVQIMTDDTLTPNVQGTWEINQLRVREFAELVSALEYTPKEYGFLSALSENGEVDKRIHVVNFVFFMVAIDHNTHTKDVSYQGTVAGDFLHGSDLLFALAESAKLKDIRLFLSDRMTRIELGEATELFGTDGGILPADLEGRVSIFRNCASILKSQYEGDFCKLLDQTRGKLGGEDGLFERLKLFPAYSDPSQKKSNLLVKLLKRDGYLSPRDSDVMDVPIDHVLMTMALRSRVVECHDGQLRAKIKQGIPLDEYQNSHLRETAKKAFREVTKYAGVDIDELDDLLWAYGRKSLRKPAPLRGVSDIKCGLDDQVNLDQRDDFILFLNGIDSDIEADSRLYLEVKGPFTRFY